MLKNPADLKICITGSTGFIGKNLLAALSLNYAVSAPSHSELDLLDTNAVRAYLEKNRFDVVVHAASLYGHNATSEYEVLATNLRMFLNLERCGDTYGKLIYFGSGAEYDSEHYIPLMPESYLGTHIPKDSYGLAKYSMSKIGRTKDNIVCLRLFAVFGKYEDWTRRFISNAILKCMFDMPVTIKQNVFFDYTYIKDLCNIVEWFIDNSGAYSDYNVCTSAPVDLISLAKAVLEVAGKSLDIIVKNEGLGREYSGSNKRLLGDMGNYRFYNLKQAVEELYEWYAQRKNEIDISKIVER